MLRCLRLNPVDALADFAHYAKQPARSLVAEIHRGCTQRKEKTAVSNQNLGD